MASQFLERAFRDFPDAFFGHPDMLGDFLVRHGMTCTILSTESAECGQLSREAGVDH